MMETLTILMPCLNEEATLAICIEKALLFCNQNKIEAEILVVDNGSTDRSPSIARDYSPAVTVVTVSAKGYGNALITGIDKAKGNWIIMGDADDTYDFTDLGKFMIPLQQGYDLVLGNRFKGKIAKDAMPFLHRYIGNPVLSFLGRLLFKVQVGDFHCGLRAGKKLKLQQLGLVCGGMEFATEMIAKAAIHRFLITDVPVNLAVDKRAGPSHLRTWSDGWRHLRFMLLYSPAWLFLYPGLFLFTGCGILTLRLFISPLKIREIVFDVHTMLYCGVGTMIGFQFVLFFIFTKTYVTTHDLMPPVKSFEKLYDYFNLERGLLTGFLIFFAGLLIAFSSFQDWQHTGFGHLTTSVTLRKVIPSFIFILMGLQIIFSSFFLSILGIKKKL